MFSLVALANMFTNKLDKDTRTPFYTFSVTGIDGSFGILGSPLPFWMQLATFLLTQSIVRVLLACVVYRYIIEKRGKTTAFLVGYGFILPLVVILPFLLIPLLDIRNMVLQISIASTPIFVFFNCLEAMYGTSPPVVEKNLVMYCIYYSSPVPFCIDRKTEKLVKVTRRETATKARDYVINVVLTLLFFSFLIPMVYAPFPSSREAAGQPISSIYNLLHWGHLLNNYIIACLTSLCLDGGTLAVGLAINILTGYSTISVMRNPLSKSSSPSDFWGRRWNRMIHGTLKRGVYLPLRQRFSRSTSALGTFVASGLLHEYVLCIISLKGRLYSNHGGHVPSYGMHIAFFAWNGLVMTIEHALKGNKALSRLRQSLPRQVVTAIVLMTVLPVSHWFTDEYVMSGFYTDYSLGFPRIVHFKS